MDALTRGDAFLFDGFQFDRRGLFRRDERGVLEQVTLGGRALDLLGILVERHGEVLSKAEIMSAVWPNSTVEEGNLTLQISALRRVLDRGRPNGSCIRTVARRGYRLAAVVRQVSAEIQNGNATTFLSGAAPLPRLSIMVLPIANLSGDPEQDCFANRITDDLTTDLSRISGSFVISCSTAFSYRGKSVDVRQIGRELGVQYVLEGSVRRLANLVRINMRLIDAGTGGHLWAERYATTQQDLPETEDEIIGQFAHTLALELVKDTGRRIEQERAADLNAQDLVMRGWAWFYRPRSAVTLQEAQKAFELALALDPDSIEARIGLATVLAAEIVEECSRPLPEDQMRVEELLTEVFAREANDLLAHLSLAMLRRSQNRLTESRIEAERAVVLDHNNSAALYELGLAHMYLGQPEAGIAHIERAIRLSQRDPRVSVMQYGLGRCHLLLGHLDQAIELFDQVRTAQPRYWDVRIWLAGALGLKGDFDRARVELAEARRLKPEIESLARWRAYQPWITVPEYQALREKTLNLGLRRAGLPDE